MWPFKYPYTNFHEMNLDWILAEIKKLNKDVENIPNLIGAAIDSIVNSLPAETEITPQMFGAVGDGATDDSAAFTAFILSLVRNGKQGFIPNGIYNIKDGIYYRSGKNDTNWGVRGESRNGVIFSVTSQMNCFDLRSISNGTIGNFTIQCLGLDGQVSGYGLYMVDVDFMNFHDINITNCARGGVLGYASSYRGVCSNNTFKNVNIFGVENNAPFDATGRKLYPMGWILTNFVNSTISDGRVDKCKYYGLEFKTFCKNSAFKDMTVTNSGTACHIGGEFEEGDTIGVTSCSYENIMCINVEQPITGNAFKNVVFNGINVINDYIPSQPLVRIQNSSDSVANININMMDDPNYVPINITDSERITVNYNTSSILNNRIGISPKTCTVNRVGPQQNIRTNMESNYGSVFSGLNMRIEPGRNIITLPSNTEGSGMLITFRHDTDTFIEFNFLVNNTSTGKWRLDKTGLHQ